MDNRFWLNNRIILKAMERGLREKARFFPNLSPTLAYKEQLLKFIFTDFFFVCLQLHTRYFAIKGNKFYYQYSTHDMTILSYYHKISYTYALFNFVCRVRIFIFLQLYTHIYLLAIFYYS